MQNGIFKLDLGTAADAIVVTIGTAIVSAVFIFLYGIVTTPGFDVLAINFATVGHQVLNISIVAAFVVVGKDFLSTNRGSVLNVTPDTTG